MKIEKILLSQNNIRLKERQKPQEQQKHKKFIDKSHLLVGTIASLGTLAISGIYFKRKESKALIEPAKSYVSDLAKGLEAIVGKEIKPESLSCIMEKSEFLEAISKLKKENFVASKENIENGIFRADLHSHSNFSDGNANIETILNQVSEYADKLNQKTGEKFLYALTDHDTAEGVKKALQIIAENPDKFKNVKFIVGSELSFLLKSNKSKNPCETSELLVYGFNPFSKDAENFFNGLKEKRLQARRDYIKDLAELFPETNFSEEEFLNIFIADRGTHFPMMNSFWQVYHYGQIKTVISDTAKAKNINSEEYFKEIMEKAPRKLNLDAFKEAKLIEDWIGENPKIVELNKKYLPEITKYGEIIPKSENTVGEIAKSFKDEDNCVIGFAHPYYISERTSDVSGVVDNVVANFGDKFKLTESYHQAYSRKILEESSKELEEINSLCEKKDLLPIGGLDNHKENWLEYFSE